MSVLVLVEHDNKNMHPATRNMVAAGLLLDPQVSCLVVGYQCTSVVEQVARIAGVHLIYVVDDPKYANPVAENVCDLIMSISKSFKAIIAPSSTYGKNILPRLSALMDASQISDVCKIVDNNTFEHPIYAGNALETVRCFDPVKILTIRTTAFEPVTQTQTPCPVENINKDTIFQDTQFIKHELSKSERPDLGSAKIIVSGGRGLQSAEKFKLIEELADVLGAAVGASRAAVDAGFVSNDYQVGQTGKIVAPALYIAIGISGAVQHLAGMKDSRIIVAINKDEDAPIFQIADYALVGDLFEIVPQLIEQLKQR